MPVSFTAYFRLLEEWLQAQGMTNVRGPFNLSINQECGLLVDGFDSPPMIMMGHARPYYAEWVERNAYKKAQDLLAYRIGIHFTFPPGVSLFLKRAKTSMRHSSIAAEASEGGFGDYPGYL